MPDDDVVNNPQLEREIAKFTRKLEALRRKAATQKTESQGIEGDLAALEEGLLVIKTGYHDDLTKRTGMYAELSEAYEDVLRKLRALKSPPFGIMTFVRFIRMEKITEDSPEVPLIEVKDVHGKIARVYFMDEKTDVNHLKYGQHLIHAGRAPNHILETLAEFKTEGVPGSIVEILTPDHNGTRFLVSTSENGTPQVMHAALCIEAGSLKKGSRVLVDTAVGLVLEILLPLETSDKYIVGEVPNVTFDDIGGLEDIKERIEKWLIHSILFPKTAKRMGRPRPKGCVLTGPPGVGKTMTAKAIVNSLHEIRCDQLGLDRLTVKPLFYSVKGPELLDKFVGESERKIRELFAEARRNSKEGIPVGIFIDEAESLLGIRGSGISSDTEKTIVPMFTAEMDGLEGSGNIVVILASNLAHNIDGAVRRPGRCDMIITVTRPNKAGAVQIFEKYLEASWEQLHPKYNVDLYTPLNRSGKPRVDDSGKTIREQFGCDPKSVRQYLIKKTVARIFDQPERSVLARVIYLDEKKQQVIHYSELISGALIANIVTRAKTIAMGRYTDSLVAKGILHRADELCGVPALELVKDGIEPLGVQLGDLLDAVEQVYKEIHVPNDTKAIRHWLLIENFIRRALQSFSR